MKKLLLGSTALVAGGLMAAPAMAADPIKIGVGGYYQFFVTAGGIEGSYALNGTSTQYKGLSFYQEGEIYFNGQTKLDNGTTIGLQVELEGWNPPASGGFVSTGSGVQTASGSSARSTKPTCSPSATGAASSSVRATRRPTVCSTVRRRLSACSTASSSTTRTRPGATLVVLGVNKAAAGISFATIGGQMQDVNRINYFTPRFCGLQIGVGYAPKINTGGSRRRRWPGQHRGVCGFNDATAQINCPTNDYSWQDFVRRRRQLPEQVRRRHGRRVRRVHVRQLRSGLHAACWRRRTWSPAPTLTPGSSGSSACSSASPASRSAARTATTTTASARTTTPVSTTTTASITAGIMYETGPWQMSFGWGYVVNNNGNGSAVAWPTIAGTSQVVSGRRSGQLDRRVR